MKQDLFIELKREVESCKTLTAHFSVGGKTGALILKFINISGVKVLSARRFFCITNLFSRVADMWAQNTDLF